MASRSQIERLTRSVERIASAIQPSQVTCIPVYDGETEAQATSIEIAMTGSELDPRRCAFNRARPGEVRADAIATGMHHFYRLGPDAIRHVLASVDGKTRGIPTSCGSDR